MTPDTIGLSPFSTAANGDYNGLVFLTGTPSTMLHPTTPKSAQRRARVHLSIDSPVLETYKSAVHD